MKWDGYLPFVVSFHTFLIYISYIHLNFIEVKTVTRQAFHRSHFDQGLIKREEKKKEEP